MGLLRRTPNANLPTFALPVPLVDTREYINASRNPYFRFKRINRLESMSTTRSSVFAVWVTVGYFELIPTAVDVVHPDGYQLGREMGLGHGTSRAASSLLHHGSIDPGGIRAR